MMIVYNYIEKKKLSSICFSRSLIFIIFFLINFYNKKKERKDNPKCFKKQIGLYIINIILKAKKKFLFSLSSMYTPFTETMIIIILVVIIMRIIAIEKKNETKDSFQIT